ncbi:MAG: flagellar basal body-associated protein FliL [Thiobacillaceae bacterium]|nr:flagellar basal body-associated protein FliL [Thiobacillaceae bacterium]MDW8322746.1 flagellar basal body-associated protein FliL [Burkholderiales bacterium]
MAETPAQNAAAPAKKKNLLIIIVIAVVALLAIGGGAVFLLTGKPAAEQQAEGEEAAAAEEEEEAKPPVYEKLETFTVNLADQESYLQVEISLKVADAKVQEKIKQHMPEVRDALLRLLSSKTAEELMTAEGKQALAEEVRKEVNRVIGAKKSKGVKEVLFTSFIVQ